MPGDGRLFSDLEYGGLSVVRVSLGVTIYGRHNITGMCANVRVPVIGSEPLSFVALRYNSMK